MTNVRTPLRRLALGALGLSLLPWLAVAAPPASAGEVGGEVGGEVVGPPRAADFATLVSEDEWIGRPGESRSWFGGTDSIAVSGSVDAIVRVDLRGPSGYFTMEFAAPRGDVLVPGTYVDARRAFYRTGSNPGIDISGDGRGCNESFGRFTVHEISPDLSTLWLSFEMRCDYRPRIALGEIAIGLDEPGAGVDVAARRVEWPELHPGVSGPVVPVRIRNDSDEAVPVTATLTSPAGDFEVQGSTCSTVAPRASCAVHVVFRPTAGGIRTGTLVVATDQGQVTVSLRGRGQPGTTSWSTRDNERYGGRADVDLTPLDQDFHVFGNESEVTFQLVEFGVEVMVVFKADRSRSLLPGTTFEDVSADLGGARDRGMLWFLDSRTETVYHSCYGNELHASFRVLDSGFLVTGAVDHITIAFIRRCSDGGVVNGVLAWRAPVAPPLPEEPADEPTMVAPEEPGTTPPAGSAPQPAPPASTTVVPVSRLRLEPTDRASVIASWTDPVPGDGRTVRVVVTSRGRAAGADQRRTVCSGRRSSCTIRDLDPRRDHTVEVVAVGHGGTASEPARGLVRGTRVRLARPQVGPRSRITAHVTDARGRALRGREVAISVREGDGSWWTAVITTGRAGRATVRHPVTRRTEVRVTVPGQGERLGVSAGPVRAG